MPGIVAVLMKRSAGALSPHSIASGILTAMFEPSRFELLSTEESNLLFLGIMHKSKDGRGKLVCGDWTVVWYGHPFYGGRPLQQVSSEELMHGLSGRRWQLVCDHLSGHFQMLLYHRTLHECLVLADKVSTHPIYYAETEHYLALTPEPLSLRALRNYGWSAIPRQGAIFEFLASGHLWADGTFWENALRLGPGQRLCFDGEELKKESYWTMVYNPADEPKQTLSARLYEAVQNDLTTLPQGRAALTLSGGYDSRALLGLLHSSRRDFFCVSYSFGENLSPNSDAVIAKHFADKLGVPHHLYKAELYDPSRLIGDIQRAIAATGGESDAVVAQDAFLGSAFYEELSRQCDYIIRGDEVWGWAGHGLTREMAFWQCYLFNLNELLQPERLLKSEAFSRALQYLSTQRECLAGEYQGEASVTDNLKDFLYWRHRESRLLQNMAYLRRCYLPHFAPFLLDRTLAVIRTIPAKLRIRKTLFLEMAKVEFPGLFMDPSVPTLSMATPSRFELIYSKPEVQLFLKKCLLENPSATLREILEIANWEQWVNSTLTERLSTSQKRKRGYNLKRFAKVILRNQGSASAKALLLPSAKALLLRLGQLKAPVQSSYYLFRLAVLALALQEYEKA
jgi:hypothetical protein